MLVWQHLHGMKASGKVGCFTSRVAWTLCGAGYVYRFTTRNDIPVMGDVEWEDK